ncbi:MAG TPA: RNA ligase family protein [Xanthobacteraceae bacterium]|nr:RNA ligase family protein [Xanthobacteraceae bacterium]
MFWRTPAPMRRPHGFIPPCIPTSARRPPAGPQWIHEIKHDGYRLVACVRSGRVRLFTRRGYDWADRYPQIVAAALAIGADVTIDGEAVVCGDDGVSDFARLHGRQHDAAAILYAFDLLELAGDDLRPRPLEERKARLAKLLSRVPVAIRYNEHLAGDGATVFTHACRMGLEGIVSKDRTRGYRSGRARHWLKIKNPQAPGTLRFKGPADA